MDARWLWIPFLLAAAPSARAHGFDPRQVPAEAAWVVHVDLAALSRCALLDGLHAQGLRPENDLDLDHVERAFGLDPFDDLASLTFYGAGARGEQVVCVAAGASRALASAWARLSEHGARAVHIEGVAALQTGGDAARFLALLAEAPGEPRVALVAPSEAALRSALLVFSGDAPTLASPRAGAPPRSTGAGRAQALPIEARPSAGSLVFAASAPVARFEDNAVFLARALGLLDELAGFEEDEELALALGTRALELDLAETRGELQVSLALDAQSASKATEIERLLRAAVARAPAATDAPQTASRLAQLLGALRLEALGSRFVARYRYAARRFVEDVGFVEEARGLRPGR